MGKVFSVFKGGASSAAIDLQNAQPQGGDVEVHGVIAEMLSRGPALLQALENYRACAELIKKALSGGTKDDEDMAFQSVNANVNIVHTFYLYSRELEQNVPRLLAVLAGRPTDKFEEVSMLQHQALAKQLAEIFHFVLKFDEIKMLKPGLQNDFSYYRRTLSKHVQEISVSDEEASFISMFLAAPIPMMTALAKSTRPQANQNANILGVLACMANMTSSTIKDHKYGNDDHLNTLLLYAMVGSIVLYDHTDQFGAFRKKSPIQMKRCVTLLPKLDNSIKMPLISALKFSTVHYKDDSTPEYVTDVLDV